MRVRELLEVHQILIFKNLSQVNTSSLFSWTSFMAFCCFHNEVQNVYIDLQGPKWSDLVTLCSHLATWSYPTVQGILDISSFSDGFKVFSFSDLSSVPYSPVDMCVCMCVQVWTCMHMQTHTSTPTPTYPYYWGISSSSLRSQLEGIQLYLLSRPSILFQCVCYVYCLNISLYNHNYLRWQHLFVFPIKLKACVGKLLV
jgi:hypothetical protein